MDPRILSLLIPVLVLSVMGIVVISQTAIGRAIARRIGGAEADQLDHRRLAALEDDVQTLRQDLMEMQERLDFTERLLTDATKDREPFRHSIGRGDD